MIFEFESPSVRMRSSIWRSSFSWATAWKRKQRGQEHECDRANEPASIHGVLL